MIGPRRPHSRGGLGPRHLRILLIAPKSEYPDVTPGWLRIPQLSLPLLAALTPTEHEVVQVEEEYEPLPLDDSWDVVGITAMTPTARRAYELASFFGQNGTKVVLGGIHPSVLPDEAARFADAVVIGEAEGVWGRVLDDARRNRLKRFYHEPRPDISDLPLPVRRRRRTLFGLPPYVMPVMASRGCPNDCEFCCVHTVYGRGQRHIPVERIAEDIERDGAKLLMFLDDNIGGRRSYAMRLFAAIEPLKVRWYAQASARFILDNELFKAAVRAGLRGLFIGVESVEPEARRKIRKSLPSTRLYEGAIARCRSAGVSFTASLIFGLDEQTPHVFDRTLEFLLSNSVPSISANVLTPYPGTRLFDRMKREGRILHTNWSYYNHSCVNYRPMNMVPEELSEKYLDFRKKFYSYSSIAKRAWSQLRVSPLMYLGMNIAMRGTVKMYRRHFREYFAWLRGRRSAPVFGGITTARTAEPASCK